MEPWKLLVQPRTGAAEFLVYELNYGAKNLINWKKTHKL